MKFYSLLSKWASNEISENAKHVLRIEFTKMSFNLRVNRKVLANITTPV